MSDRIHLRGDDRKALLRHYRGSPVPAVRLRCHVLLLLDAGHPWALIAAVLFTSSATINRWRRAYLRGGADAVPAGGPGAAPRWRAGVGGDDRPLGGRPRPGGLRARPEPVDLRGDHHRASRRPRGAGQPGDGPPPAPRVGPGLEAAPPSRPPPRPRPGGQAGRPAE